MMATSSDRGPGTAFNCGACQAELPSYISALHRGATRGARFDAMARHLLTCVQCRHLAWDTFIAIGWRDQLSPVVVPPPDLSFLHAYREQSND